jgi:hypothetical protein
MCSFWNVKVSLSFRAHALIYIYIIRRRRIGHAEQDRQNWTSGMGQAELYRQDGTSRMGQAEQERKAEWNIQKRTNRLDWQNGTGGKG